VPAHALAGHRISWHGRRYRVLPERGGEQLPPGSTSRNTGCPFFHSISVCGHGVGPYRTRSDPTKIPRSRLYAAETTSNAAAISRRPLFTPSSPYDKWTGHVCRDQPPAASRMLSTNVSHAAAAIASRSSGRNPPGPREAWATTSRAQRTVWIKVACVTPYAAR
jgi:hypothetical protein